MTCQPFYINTAMIKIENLKKKFGDTEACDIPNLEIGSGEIIGLVGNNGAGKTTLFRLMLDLLKADSGNVSIDGIPINKTEEWKLFTSAYIDSGFLIDFLTPQEYMDFIAQAAGMTEDWRNQLSAEEQSSLSHLSQFMGEDFFRHPSLIRELSSGNKQKLGIMGAIISMPRLLILDEPFNFLDPSSQNNLKKLLVDYNRTTNATIIISSHNLTHTIDISRRILLMEKGNIIMDSNHIDEAFISQLNRYFGA